jgi:hypothetical protein
MATKPIKGFTTAMTSAGKTVIKAKPPRSVSKQIAMAKGKARRVVSPAKAQAVPKKLR